MELINDVVNPVELTGMARAAAQERDSTATFSQFLPNLFIDDVVARSTDLVQGQAEVASVRAYDAEAPLGRSADKVARVTFDLPPVSQKHRVSEYSQIRNRAAMNAGLPDAINRYSIQLGEAIADRAEMFRAEVLITAKINLDNENGVFANVDFGRDAELEPEATAAFSDADSTPLTDLLEWKQIYLEANGFEPGVIVLSDQVINNLTKNKEIIGIATDRAAAKRVTPAVVRQVLAEYGFNQIQSYDRRVNIGGTLTRLMDVDRMLMLPSAPVGRTVYGTTVEASDPQYNYGIAPQDTPGIVVGAFRQNDPAGIWVHGNSITAPVMPFPNQVLSAKIG